MTLVEILIGLTAGAALIAVAVTASLFGNALWRKLFPAAGHPAHETYIGNSYEGGYHHYDGGAHSEQ
jgi:hypothetical protein